MKKKSHSWTSFTFPEKKNLNGVFFEAKKGVRYVPFLAKK